MQSTLQAVHMRKPPPRARERPSGARTGNVHRVLGGKWSGRAGDAEAGPFVTGLRRIASNLSS